MKLQVLLVLILLISINEADTTRRFGIRDELNKPMDDISVEDLLVDKIMKDALLHKSGYLDSSTFSQLVNYYLDGLMVQFRTRVFNLYRRITCGNGFCEPWNPELGLSQTELLQRPSALKMTVSSIMPWHECSLPRPVESFVTFKKGLKTFFVVGSESHQMMSLYQLEGNGQCKFVGDYNATINPCFATFDNDDFPFVIVGHCGAKRNGDYVYVHLITDNGLKMTEILEVANLTKMFTVVHGKLAYVCFLTLQKDLQTCRIYQWTDTTFTHVTNFNVTFGKVVKPFIFGRQTFLASTYYDGDDSPVTIWQFIPDAHRTSLKLYQILNNCYSSDVEPFTVSGLQFLAVACMKVSHNESYLYWWTGTQFLMWQSIAVRGVVSWLSLKLNNDDAVLVAHACEKNNTLHVFELGDGYYFPTQIYHLNALDRYNAQLYPQKAQYFGVNLLTTIENRLHEAKFTTYRLLIDVTLPVQLATNEDVLGCLKTVEKTIREHDPKLRRVEKVLAEMRRRKDESSLSSKMTAQQSVNFDNSKCEQLDARVGQMEKKITRIERFSRQHKDWETPADQGSLRVETLVVRGTLTTPSLFVKSGMINGVDLSDLRQTVVSKTMDQVFKSSVSFQEGLDVRDVTIGSTLNGQMIGNLAMNGRTNVFTAPQHFSSLSVGRLQVEETVNGIDVNDVVLKNSRQIIHGRKTIKRLHLNGDVLLRGGKINGVDVRDFASRVLTVSGNQRITGPVKFLGNVKIRGSMNCPTIDGIVFSEFVKKIVTTNTPQIITGLNVFTSDMVIKKARLRGKLNGLKVPDDFLMKYTNQVFPGDVEIVGNVFVDGNIEVKGRVNGLDLSKDVVTRCGNHTITGLKEFKDEVTVNELLYLESGKMWQHFGDVTVDELEIEELNGININAFLDNVIRKSKPQTLKGLLECDKVIFKDVVVNELNGGKLDVMYMTTNTNQTISAPVIFKSDVFVNGPIRMRDTATVNGIDISELPNICVMKTGNQIIRGRKSFREIIPLKGIKTEGENERVLDLLLRKAGNKLHVASVDGNVELEDHFRCNYLNDRHLDTFLSQMYTVDKSISLDAKFFDKIVVNGDLNLNHLNGLNVDEFLDKVIRLSSNQVIAGNAKFTRPVTCHGPVFAKTVNGLILEMKVNNIVRDDGRGRIRGLVTFRNGLEVNGDINVEFLNGWNFTNVMDKILLDTNQYFKGTTIVVGDVVVGDLQVAGHLNGLRTSDFVLLNQTTTLHNDVIIKAPVAFSSLSVHGTVKIPLKEKDSPHFKHLKAKRVVLKGTLNDIRVEDLPSMMLSKSRPQTFSTHSVIFENDVSIDHLNLKRPIINGIDLNEFRLRAFTKDTRQTITGKKTWSSASSTAMYGGVEVKGNVTASKITTASKLDIAGMSRIVNKTEAFRKGGAYHGDLYLDDDLHVKGLINNLDLAKDVVLRDRDQTFLGMHFDGDVEVENLIVDGLVNGIDLKRLIEKRVTLSTDQIVKTNITFHNVTVRERLECSDVEVGPSVIQVRKDLTFGCPVVINGSVDFKRPLKTERGYMMDLYRNSKQMNGSTCLRCLQNVLMAAKRLAGQVNHLEAVNRFVKSHAMSVVSQNGSVYVVLATPRMSPLACNNLKTFRCNGNMTGCHPIKGMVKLPKGFVSKIFDSENGQLKIQAYVTTATPQDSKCSSDPPGVHIFRGVRLDLMTKIFIPAAEVSDVIVWSDGPESYAILTSAQFGYKILKIKDRMTKVVGGDQRRVLAMTTLQSPIGQEIYFVLDVDYMAGLTSISWNWSKRKVEKGIDILVPKGVNDMAAFRVGKATYFALAYDVIRVCLFENSTCTFSQEVLQFARILRAVEYYGRVYMMVAGEYEVVLYKWSDLLGFRETTKVSSPRLVERANLFWHHDVMYLYVSTAAEKDSAVTTLYKAHVFGNNLHRDC